MSRTVLLVEDNEQNAYLATFLLNRAGYQVISAADGDAALQLAITTRPTFIVLDIQLPGMDGYELARGLRAIEALRDTPILAVTSYAMVGDRERSLAVGCTGYLEKPIDPLNFVAELERQAGLPRQTPEAR